MSEFLLGYEKIPPMTWVYLSSFLMLGLFFKFNRVFSVRNLDLVLMVLLGPGMLMVLHPEIFLSHSTPASALESNSEQPAPVTPELPGDAASSLLSVEGATQSELVVETAANAEPAPNQELLQRQRLRLIGYIWLFVVGALFMIRMLFDALMTRRPLLEPNLTAGGLTFIGCSLFVFLMANVITSPPTKADLEGPQSAKRLLQGNPVSADDNQGSRHGPGYALIFMLPSIPTVGMVDDEDFVRGISNVLEWELKNGMTVTGRYLRSNDQTLFLRDVKGQVTSVPVEELVPEDRAQLSRLGAYVVIAKLMAIIAHLAVVVGIVLIGYQHFGNIKMGLGPATLYLMLPYTAQMTGRVEHVIPAALLIWAIYFYRRPLAAGMFLGLAAGVVYYPLFLLPLWISFYWQRGLGRFLTGVLSMLGILALSLIFVSTDFGSYLHNLRTMFGIRMPILNREALEGLWRLGWDPNFRLPLLFAFIGLSISFTIWPAQKNLGTLLSCSAALMIATQFWHGYGGGLFMAWYLPLALLTIFRPNLEDRVALSVLGEGWLNKRRRGEKKSNLAA